MTDDCPSILGEKYPFLKLPSLFIAQLFIIAWILSLSLTAWVSFFVFKNKEQRNEFIERTKGMLKVERETIYQEYLS